MSKIRIYELAKELGVDNKIVINVASDIGVPGKLSHSNSLDADEADQIRRAVIRQAIGTSPESQVVTTRVNKSTGEANTVVESRKGNVIRRRKREGAEEAEAPIAAESAEEASTEEAAEQAEQPSEMVKIFDREVNLDPAKQTVVVENDPFAAPTATTRAQRNKDVEIVEVQAQEEAPAEEEVKKSTAGPRVLGKISLPQKKAAAKATGSLRPSASGQNAVAFRPVEEEESDENKRKGAGARKKTKKREISRLELVDYEGRMGGRKAHKPGKLQKQKETERPADSAAAKVGKKNVKIASEVILVGELAKQMSVKVGEVIAKLMELGVLATINQSIDVDTATIVAEELGYQVERTGFDEKNILKQKDQDDPASLVSRSPVVTVMGHVDHGKTTLLDTIRKTAVAAKEHGGITQHIGAYGVKLDNDRSITFIDTPGHAAFTTMRARGAQVTDVVVLVVAADDGVMPQTIEAVNHAKAAGVPIVVAVNKIDKPNTTTDRLKTQLAELGLNPEEWGGDTLYFPVSALKGTGIKELLEGILLVVEMKDLRANPARRASGTVIEARQDKGRGSVATILVQNGTLHVGDVFVSGAEFGRIRSMTNSSGEKVDQAGPSTPVEITGLSGVPFAGDDFFVVENEADARQVSSERANKKLASEQRLASGPISLEEFARRANNMGALGLNIILKADVHGSLEAGKTAIEQLTTEKVKVRVIHSGVGGITESDVQLAIASKAIIVGFGVRAETRATTEAENANVELRFYRIIYEMIDDIKLAMAGLLAPIKKENHLGRVEVRETFNIPKIGTIAGCYVTQGVVKRSGYVRLLRDKKVVYEGKIAALKRFKDDAREVQSGYECGLSIENYNDIKVGDEFEVYDIEEVAATL